MNKKYKGIFFDWDGTAVTSRKAPVDQVVGPMKALLSQGIKLAVISGTTMENIGEGRLHTYFTVQERKNLFFGLGRGAYNYSFDDLGQPYIFQNRLPDSQKLLQIHEVSYRIHRQLLERYGIPTDIVFSRPNYCKIDLMVENNRGDALFLQEGEKEKLLEMLSSHGFGGGLSGMINLAKEIGKEEGLPVIATTDGKYLEVGISSKSDNVEVLAEYFKEHFDIGPRECAFWGDEYLGFGEGIYGSDSFMITPRTREGDFFDVSQTLGERPREVQVVGGGVSRFLEFLREQAR